MIARPLYEAPLRLPLCRRAGGVCVLSVFDVLAAATSLVAAYIAQHLLGSSPEPQAITRSPASLPGIAVLSPALFRFKRLRSVRFCRCAEEVDEVDWGAQQHEPLAPNSDTGLTFPVTPQQQQSPSPPESPETPGYTEDALCKLPYWMAVVLALCIFSGLLGGLGWACTIDVAHFVSRIDVYKEQASSVYDSLRDWAESHNIDLDSVWPKLEPIAEKMAEAVAIDVLQFVASFVLVLIFTVYLLMVKHDYPAGTSSHTPQVRPFGPFGPAIGSRSRLCCLLLTAMLLAACCSPLCCLLRAAHH